MASDYITFTIGKKKNIALIAHDNEKPKLIGWCSENKEALARHNLCGTGTTARMIADQTGLRVRAYNSGPFRRRSADRGQDRGRPDRFRRIFLRPADGPAP